MGGAIAVHVAASKLLKTLVGLVVIDVVEGMCLLFTYIRKAFC